MVRISGPKALGFQIEQLEDRCVLAGLPWPVPLDSIDGIIATYGQFDNRGDWIHFHEGIDVRVAVGTKVTASEAGTVVGLVADQGYNNHVSIATTPNSGWNYIHLQPDPALVAAFKKGPVTLQAKDLIGTVVQGPPNIATHLHIDAAGGKDPTDPNWLRPIEDPLARLKSLGDDTGPWVTDVNFLVGENDNDNPHNLEGGELTEDGNLINQVEPDPLPTHGYFNTVDFSETKIVGHFAPAKTSAGVTVGGTSNIDIVANARDMIFSTGPLVGIRSIEFKAAGQFSQKTIPVVRPFDFAGAFVPDPNQKGGQNYDSLHISDLTRVVYENDVTSPSNAQAPDDLKFFHIITNTDGANKAVEVGDRNSYWRSKVTQGSGWNDIASKEAVSNATGAFPDDYYTYTITARDAAGNATSKDVRVLLDNWVQQLNITGAAAPNIFFLSGSQFLPNADVPIYAIPTGVTLSDGDIISRQCVLVGHVTTDANGAFSNFMVMVPPYGNFSAFVADYGGRRHLPAPARPDHVRRGPAGRLADRRGRRVRAGRGRGRAADDSSDTTEPVPRTRSDRCPTARLAAEPRSRPAPADPPRTSRPVEPPSHRRRPAEHVYSRRRLRFRQPPGAGRPSTG